MTKKRIYAVTTSHAKPVTRLVRAESAAQAFRAIASEIITAELASQDDLIDATKAGIPVEEVTGDDPKPAEVIVPVTAEELKASAEEFPDKPVPEPIELPAHMDRRQKAAAG